MSNVNDYFFANQLEIFNKKVIDPQRKRVDDAEKIMHDLSYPWKNAEEKNLGEAKLQNYKAGLLYYLEFYKQGLLLVNQHETLVNRLAKWYDCWYCNISNEGKQETEIMPSQADLLSEIFCDIYQELKPLNLEIKPPKALNLLWKQYYENQ